MCAPMCTYVCTPAQIVMQSIGIPSTAAFGAGQKFAALWARVCAANHLHAPSIFSSQKKLWGVASQSALLSALQQVWTPSVEQCGWKATNTLQVREATKCSQSSSCHQHWSHSHWSQCKVERKVNGRDSKTKCEKTLLSASATALLHCSAPLINFTLHLQWLTEVVGSKWCSALQCSMATRPLQAPVELRNPET